MVCWSSQEAWNKKQTLLGWCIKLNSSLNDILQQHHCIYNDVSPPTSIIISENGRKYISNSNNHLNTSTKTTSTTLSTTKPEATRQQQHQKQHVNNNKNGFVETNNCNVLNVLFCSVNTTESMIYFIQTTFWDSVSNCAICKSTTNSAHSFLFVKDIKKTQCKTKCDLYLLKVMVAKL